MTGKLKQLTTHILPGILKPLRVLWNEMIGFVFICFGLLPIPSAYRAYSDGDNTRFAMSGVFSLIMLYFGVTSFFKARKISRS